MDVAGLSRLSEQNAMVTGDLGAELTARMQRGQKQVSDAADERAELWLEAMAAGANGAEIAAACDVSENTVWRELRRVRAAK